VQALLGAVSVSQCRREPVDVVQAVRESLWRGEGRDSSVPSTQEERHMEKEPSRALAMPEQGPSRGHEAGAMQESRKPPAVLMESESEPEVDAAL
jgi:hypothetical protein